MRVERPARVHFWYRHREKKWNWNARLNHDRLPLDKWQHVSHRRGQQNSECFINPSEFSVGVLSTLCSAALKTKPSPARAVFIVSANVFVATTRPWSSLSRGHLHCCRMTSWIATAHDFRRRVSQMTTTACPTDNQHSRNHILTVCRAKR